MINTDNKENCEGRIMEEKQIISHNTFDEINIDKSRYTQSLAAEACRIGLITEDDVGNIRMKMMEQLAVVVEMYTQSKSTSVRTDTAKRLMDSMLFNIDTYLLSLNDHEKALEKLFLNKYDQLYGNGFLINRKSFENAKMLYAKARYSRRSLASEAYERTMGKDLYEYLKQYDPKFSAHDKLTVNLPEVGFKGKLVIHRVVDL